MTCHRSDLEMPNGACRGSGDLKEDEWCWWEPTPGNLFLVYRPPGCDHEWTAPVTADRSKADKRGGDGTFWWWNGDRAAPTLEPSLGVPWPPPFTWHGWMRDGAMVPA